MADQGTIGTTPALSLEGRHFQAVRDGDWDDMEQLLSDARAALAAGPTEEDRAAARRIGRDLEERLGGLEPPTSGPPDQRASCCATASRCSVVPPLRGGPAARVRVGGPPLPKRMLYL